MRLLSSTYPTLHTPHDNEPEMAAKENSENSENKCRRAFCRTCWRKRWLCICCPSLWQIPLEKEHRVTQTYFWQVYFIHVSPNLYFKTTSKIYNMRQVKLIFMFVVFTKEPLTDLLNFTFHLSLTMMFRATQEREPSSVLSTTIISTRYCQWGWEAVQQ